MSDLQSWVGRSQIKTEQLCPRLVGWMAATLNRTDLLDPAVGKTLPPGWHWMFFNQVEPRDRIGPDGHPLRGDFLPPVDLPRRMWAGSRLHWHRPLTVGMSLSREATIRKVERKAGRLGEMVFVTVGYVYRHDQVLLLEEEHDIVYRGDPSEEEKQGLASLAARAKAFEGAFERCGDLVERAEADTTTLFRYSAATFNGHRIHYDLPYAREVEAYPGLVVHGPLIATMLLGLLMKQAGPCATIERFAFRAKRPTFLISPFHLHLSRAAEPGSYSLWSTNNVGEVALDCSAIVRVEDQPFSSHHEASPFLPVCPQ